MLAPGGVLAVITASTAACDDTLTDLAGQVVASARAAGLVYAQHIVLVHAAIHGAQLVPGPAAGGRRPARRLPRPFRPAGLHQARRNHP